MKKLFLKSINLNGFKSFGNPTKIELSNGINLFLGPHNVSKSNLIYAIAWALCDLTPSERSAESILFNGTKSKEKADFAEVSLNYGISNILDETDIAIARRLEKNEKGKFFIGTDQYSDLELFKKNIQSLNLPDLCLIDDFNKKKSKRNDSAASDYLEAIRQNKQTILVLNSKKLIKEINPSRLIGITTFDEGISSVINLLIEK